MVTTPWVWAYWPVKKLARDGLHSDVVTKAFSNITPSLAIRSKLGVSMKGCPMQENASQR